MKSYAPVRRCIYCGVSAADAPEPLGREHIIPLSLGGTIVLPRSSCIPCGRITRAFEQTCARKMFGPYRVAGNLPTRHPEERPDVIEIALHFGPGTERTKKMIPAAIYPIIATVAPELQIAGILTGAPTTDRFECIPRILQMWRPHPDHARTFTDPAQQFEVSRELPMTEFARLLAKIAHSYAVAELGLDAFDYLLPPLILGKGLNLPDYIGGTKPLEPGGSFFLGDDGKPVGFLIQHYLNWEKVHSKDGMLYLTILIGLLNPFYPRYRIVVAKC